MLCTKGTSNGFALLAHKFNLPHIRIHGSQDCKSTGKQHRSTTVIVPRTRTLKGESQYANLALKQAL